jgi:hypothetical protein
MSTGKLARRRIAPALAALAVALPLASCGDDSSYANDPRPPVPVAITASIAKDAISLSPRKLGAGPVLIVFTNQSGNSQDASIESSDSPGSGTGTAAQTTGPINPQDTASLQLDLREGEYVIGVKDDAIKPARLQVGPQRESSQNQLLLP